MKILTFQDVGSDVENDQNLQEEISIMYNVLTQLSRYQEDRQLHSGQRWKLPPNGQPITLFSGVSGVSKTIIRPDDDSKCFFLLFLFLLKLFF